METENIDIEDSMIQELSEDLDLESIKLPYILKDKILMSPGVWNSYYYSSDVIREAFNTTDWESKENRSLFLDHNDDRSSEWIGEIKNTRINGDDLVGDLVVLDKPTAIKLAYGAKMGISPKVHGPAEGNVMHRFTFDNFSVVINPAVKTAWINNSQNFDLENLDDFIDVYKSFLEAEEVTETMSKYTDFLKKYIKAHPDIPVAEAMKKAGKEWQKVKGGNKMEEEVKEEPQEEPKEEPKEELQEKPKEEPKKKQYPYPEEKKMDEEEKPEEKSEELAEIKIMLEHVLAELAKKKEEPKEEIKEKPKEEKKMDEEVEEKPEEKEEVKEMSQKVQKLEEEVKRLNEPNKVSIKQELSETDVDMDMMNFLRTL